MIIFLGLHILIVVLFFILWRSFSDRERGFTWPSGTPVTLNSPGRFVVNLVLIAVVLRLLCLTVIMIFFPEMIDRTSAVYGWRDDLTYHDDAISIMSLWQGQYATPSGKMLHIDYLGYPLVLAAIYYVTGPYHVIGVLFNIIFGALTCVLVYLIGKDRFDEDIGRQGALLLALLPLHIYICCFTLKDPLVLLFIILAVYCAQRAILGKRLVGWLLLLTFSLGFMLILRRQASLVLVAVILGGFWVARPLRALKATPVIVVLVLTTVLFYTEFKELTFMDYFSGKIMADQHEMVLSMQGMTPELEEKGTLLLGVLGYILPFPTLYPLDEDIDPRYHLESSVFIWNLLAGLSLVGILICWRRKLRDTWIIWATPLVIFLGQTLVYMDTILDIRRGKFMLTPFACLLGVYALREWQWPSRSLWFLLYLVVVFVGTLTYTYYRLSSRGII